MKMRRFRADVVVLSCIFAAALAAMCAAQPAAKPSEADIEARLTQLRAFCQKNLRQEAVAQFKDEDIGAWVDAYADKTIGIGKAVEALSLRGTSFSAVKDYERAKADFELSVKLSPTNGYSWNSLGSVYLTMKEEDKALDAFIKAFEYDQKQHTAKSFGWMPISSTLEAASIYMTRGKYPEALAVLEHYNEDDARQMGGYSGCRILRAYGQVYAATGEEDQAMAKFKMALELEKK